MLARISRACSRAGSHSFGSSAMLFQKSRASAHSWRRRWRTPRVLEGDVFAAQVELAHIDIVAAAGKILTFFFKTQTGLAVTAYLDRRNYHTASSLRSRNPTISMP